LQAFTVKCKRDVPLPNKKDKQTDKQTNKTKTKQNQKQTNKQPKKETPQKTNHSSAKKNHSDELTRP